MLLYDVGICEDKIVVNDIAADAGWLFNHKHRVKC